MTRPIRPKTDRRAEAQELYRRELRRLRIQSRARAKLREEEADKAFTPPSSDWSLKEALAKPDTPLPYTIEGLHPTGGNSLIAAQYKVGKTTLMMNLAKSWADGDPFLGVFQMSPGPGRLAFFNYELTEANFNHEIRKIGIECLDRISPLHLRGHNFDLRSPAASSWAADWLAERECTGLILDPYGAAAQLQNENDNSEALRWLRGCVDPLKADAGVVDLWMPAHTGRAEAEEGQERARGATGVDDWADVRINYTGQKIRLDSGEWVRRTYFSAHGRAEVDVKEVEVGWDKYTGRLCVEEFRSRGQARLEAGVADVVRVVTEQPGIATRNLIPAIHGRKEDRPGHIEAAIRQGLIHIRPGPRNALCHFPGPAPKEES